MKRVLSLLAIVTAGIIVPNANASVCASTTDCIFTFNTDNGFGGLPSSGTFGTVELTLSGGNINFNIDLADSYGFKLIQTGIADGTFGFNQSGTTAALTYSNFTSTTQPGNTGNYSGPGGPDLSFSAFGTFDSSILGPGPSGNGGNGANQLSFTVSRSGGFTDVNQLVDLSVAGGLGSAYFVADVIRTTGCTSDACTGLIAVTGTPSAVPEPISSALVGTGLIALSLIRRRRASCSSI